MRCLILSLAPLQLLAQNVEERLVGRLNQQDVEIGRGAFHHVAALQGIPDLAIHREVGVLVIARLTIRIGISEGTISGLLVSVWGQIGVRQKAFNSRDKRWARRRKANTRSNRWEWR